MYNPTDRLERALGTRSDQRFSDPPVPHLQRSKVSQPMYSIGLTELNLSWRTSGFVLPTFLGPSGSGGGTGRGGTATVCSWDWNTPLFQGKRSVTTLGTCWGKAWGSGKEFPGCRHMAECSLWLLGAAGRAGGSGALWPRAHPGEGDVI